MTKFDLHSFLAALPATTGESICIVEREVSQDHEMWAVVKAMEPHGNPIIQFNNIKGSTCPVLVGITATRRRIAAAMNVPVQEGVAKIQHAIDNPIQSIFVDNAPIDDALSTGDDVSLNSLPIGTHSPDDGGRFLTAAVTALRDPVSGKVNTGIYRTMVVDDKSVSINAPASHDLAKILDAATEAGEAVDVAMIVGHHPALSIASQAKNPMDVDSYDIAGALMDEPLALTPGATIDLPVPALSEIVIEGRVYPGERADEGPFGDFTYTYGAGSGYLCRITAIRQRKKPIFVALHPSHKEHRALWLYPGREARLLTALQTTMPMVTGVRLPEDGFSMNAIISVANASPGLVRRILMTAFGLDIYLKNVVVVDNDVDIFSDADILWALTVRMQADRDLLIIPNSSGPRTDPTAYSSNARGKAGSLTTKLGIDATVSLPWEYADRSDGFHPSVADIDLADYVAPEFLSPATGKPRD